MINLSFFFSFFTFFSSIYLRSLKKKLKNENQDIYFCMIRIKTTTTTLTMNATAATATPMEIQSIVEYFQRFFALKNAGDRINDEHDEAIVRLLSEVHTPIMNLFKSRFDEKLGRGTPLSDTDWSELENRISSISSFTKSLTNGRNSLSMNIYNGYKMIVYGCVLEQNNDDFMNPRLLATPKVPITVEEMRTYYFDMTERDWILRELSVILSPLETEFQRINNEFELSNAQIEEDFDQFMSTTSDDEFKSKISTLISLPDVETHFPVHALASIREFVSA